MLRHAAILAAFFPLAACQTADAQDGPVPAAQPQPAAAAPQQGQVAEARKPFGQWLQELRQEALSRGIRPATFDSALAGVQPNPEIVELTRRQPEFTKAIWAYLDSAVSKTRVETGRSNLLIHRPTLERASRAYGVQPEYIVAIWGLESNYGQNFGSYYVIEALATLAYATDRGPAFRTYLLQALEILDDGHIAREQMRGSWAGAMGHTQFMPESFLRFAVDFDGDGRRDLWGSLPDVFASTANYLQNTGWEPTQPWGEEVRLPQDFPWQQTELDHRRPVGEWRAMGVRPAGGGGFRVTDTVEASIIVPAGHRGPAFIAYPNFRRIMRYNNSTAYALAIGHLADRIAGGGEFMASWPRGDQPLSRSQQMEMQRLLTARGYSTGGVDGVIGPNTRAAIRAYQRDTGRVQDGYASAELLRSLQQGV